MTTPAAAAGPGGGPGLPADYNFAAALFARRRAAGDGGRVALVESARTWTYDEIEALTGRTAHALTRLGVRREARVLIALPDSAEFVASFLGAIAVGAVAVPCNTFLGAADYAYFLAESRADVLVTTRPMHDALAAVLAAAAAPPLVLLVEGDEDRGRTRAWRRWVGEAPTALPAVDTHRDAPAFWLWTSGSTGQPKAAVHLHQDWPWCCEGFGVGVVGLTGDDRVFSAAKLFHAYGLGNALAFPFWVGAPAVLLAGRATAEAVFATLAAHAPTVFFGVPTLYAAVLQRAAQDRSLGVGALRLAVSAGEPLPPELYRRWRERFGVELLDAPGSTEVLHCYLSPRPGRVTPGSVGEPVPGYAMRIVDEHGHDVADGVEGELWVHGRSTAVSYWQRRDQTAAKMHGPWFASGDRYRRDAEGRYWHIGRTDDMFKVAGEWCSATEVEAALVAHDAVAECAVVPHPDADGVLKPRAVVVVAASAVAGEALAEALRAFVRSRLAHYKCPRTIDFVGELPKTATGKIQRYKLRDGTSG
ncbi:MAG: benzoate-CoA ligase family protein [Vicinamibacterales bacterium]